MPENSSAGKRRKVRGDPETQELEKELVPPVERKRSVQEKPRKITSKKHLAKVSFCNMYRKQTITFYQMSCFWLLKIKFFFQKYKMPIRTCHLCGHTCSSNNLARHLLKRHKLSNKAERRRESRKASQLSRSHKSTVSTKKIESTFEEDIRKNPDFWGKNEGIFI